jgi:hypothetical protein
MKNLIRLALAALVTYAAWNGGNAWLTYIKFKDDVSQLTQYGGKFSEDELRGKILETANERSVPLADDAFTVRRDERQHTFVDGRYTQPISVLPWYAYPYTFEFHTDTFTLDAASNLKAR